MIRVHQVAQPLQRVLVQPGADRIGARFRIFGILKVKTIQMRELVRERYGENERYNDRDVVSERKIIQ